MHPQWLKFSRLWLSTICLGLLAVIGCAVPITLGPATTTNRHYLRTGSPCPA